jgi:hypothetical protein
VFVVESKSRRLTTLLPPLVACCRTLSTPELFVSAAQHRLTWKIATKRRADRRKQARADRLQEITNLLGSNAFAPTWRPHAFRRLPSDSSVPGSALKLSAPQSGNLRPTRHWRSVRSSSSLKPARGPTRSTDGPACSSLGCRQDFEMQRRCCKTQSAFPRCSLCRGLDGPTCPLHCCRTGARRRSIHAASLCSVG